MWHVHTTLTQQLLFFSRNAIYLFLVCAARGCNQMAKNLFDNGANISFHFEASNLFVWPWEKGKIQVSGLEKDIPCKHFVFSSNVFCFHFGFVGISVFFCSHWKVPTLNIKKSSNFYLNMLVYAYLVRCFQFNSWLSKTSCDDMTSGTRDQEKRRVQILLWK